MRRKRGIKGIAPPRYRQAAARTGDGEMFTRCLYVIRFGQDKVHYTHGSRHSAACQAQGSALLLSSELTSAGARRI